jgi:hypothetical protein
MRTLTDEHTRGALPGSVGLRGAHEGRFPGALDFGRPIRIVSAARRYMEMRDAMRERRETEHVDAELSELLGRIAAEFEADAELSRYIDEG